MASHAAWGLIAAAACLALAGCSTGSLYGDSSGGTASGGNATGSALDLSAMDTDGLAVYLDMMERLADGNPVTQAETFNSVENDWRFVRTTTNRLRYALALSVPGHPGSDPAAAAENLRNLIAATGALPPDARMLATIQLRQAERLMILEENRAELRARAEAAQAEAEAENNETIESLRAENARLRTELENTTEMLDAITSIEESISEREEP